MPIARGSFNFLRGFTGGEGANSNPVSPFLFMDMFADDLSHAIFMKTKSPLDHLISGMPEFKERAFHELDNFLIYIHSKADKIRNYINTPLPINNKIYTANTGNFIFTYTIFPNKESQIDVALLTKTSRRFGSSFLTDRIKPLFGYVYFLYSQYGFKIGCTKDIDKRINSFGVLLPFETTLHSAVKCKDYSSLESQLHKLLDHKRLNGEWFTLEDSDFNDIDAILNNMNLKRLPA
jgi:hypothetical protein